MLMNVEVVCHILHKVRYLSAANKNIAYSLFISFS